MELTRKLNSNIIFDLLYFGISNTLLYMIRLINSIHKNKTGIILIVSFHKLGDSVFTIPAVKELKDHYFHQNQEVVILTFPECIPIYKTSLIDVKIISIERKEFKFNTRIASFNAIRKVKKLLPKIIFDLTGSITSSFLIAQSRASRIVGLNQKYYKSIYTDFISIRKTPDLMDRYLDVVKVIKKIENPTILKQFPVNYIRSGKIYINPFAGWKAKEWNLRKYIQLAEELIESYDVNFICERGQMPEFIVENLKILKIPVIYTDSIDELILEIDRCALFIGNDTGPLYIAYLKGKPTYAIFGPTAVKYPYKPGTYHKFVQKMLPCSPLETQYCFTEAGRFCPSYECMHNLSVEEVKTDILQFISALGLKENSPKYKN